MPGQVEHTSISLPISERFAAYDEFGPVIPVWCITPAPLERCIHRFFDSSAISPSGRYVALTQLPDETRPPYAGEPADVVVVDLYTAQWEIVARTHGYDTRPHRDPARQFRRNAGAAGRSASSLGQAIPPVYLQRVSRRHTTCLHRRHGVARLTHVTKDIL